MDKINHILVEPNELLSLLHLTNLESAIVYLAGSLLEGFGNATSDIDVYVLCEEEDISILQNKKSKMDGAFYFTDDCITRNIRINGSRYDIEYWSHSKLTNMIMKLNKLDFTTTDYITRLSKEEFDVLHRIKYAKGIHNTQEFDRIYNSINFDNLNYYKIIIQSELYAGVVEDVQGAYLSKDFGSAFFMVRNLINIVMTGYLAGKGETNPADKWLYRKLQRYRERIGNNGDDNLMEEYVRLQTRDYSLESIDSYIKEVLGYCQKLNKESQNMLRDKQIESTSFK